MEQSIHDEAEAVVQTVVRSPHRETLYAGNQSETALRPWFQIDVLAQIEDAVIGMDDAHRILFWNAAAERLYRKPAERVLGRRLPDILSYRWLHPEEEHAANRALATVGHWRGENIVTLEEETEIVVETATTRLVQRSGEPGGYLCIVRDITDRPGTQPASVRPRRLREERPPQETQPWEHAGALPEDLAHDLNNLLMALLGNVELALLEVPPESQVGAYLRRTEVAVTRVANLIRQASASLDRSHHSANSL